MKAAQLHAYQIHWGEDCFFMKFNHEPLKITGPSDGIGE